MSREWPVSRQWCRRREGGEGRPQGSALAPRQRGSILNVATIPFILCRLSVEEEKIRGHIIRLRLIPT
jgi:hypothetical protein